MRYIKMIMGNVLIAGAYACITVPKEIVNGGVTSFSMILSKMTRIPTAWLADAFSVAAFGSVPFWAWERVFPRDNF